MCSRHSKALSWVFPLQPNYKGYRPKLKKAAHGLRQDLDELDDHAVRDTSAVARYLEELLYLTRILGEPTNQRNFAGFQERYSTMTRITARVYELAVRADLPFDCRFEFETVDIEALRFGSEAAKICRIASEDIVDASIRSARGGASELEIAIELQGELGRIYLKLAQDLRKAGIERLDLAERNIGRDLLHLYRTIGKGLLSLQDLSRAGDYLAVKASAAKITRYEKRARSLARKIDLFWCIRLI